MLTATVSGTTAPLMNMDPEQAPFDWIEQRAGPHFLCSSKLKPTDFYFVPANAGSSSA